MRVEKNEAIKITREQVPPQHYLIAQAQTGQFATWGEGAKEQAAYTLLCERLRAEILYILNQSRSV